MTQAVAWSRHIASRYAHARTLPVLAAAASMLVAGTAFAQSAQQVATGKALAQRLCAQCHAVTSAQGGGWTDAPSFQSIADRPTTTAAWLSDFLRKPHEKMLNDQHAAAEASALKAYILSLKQH